MTWYKEIKDKKPFVGEGADYVFPSPGECMAAFIHACYPEGNCPMKKYLITTEEQEPPEGLTSIFKDEEGIEYSPVLVEKLPDDSPLKPFEKTTCPTPFMM